MKLSNNLKASIPLAGEGQMIIHSENGNKRKIICERVEEVAARIKARPSSATTAKKQQSHSTPPTQRPKSASSPLRNQRGNVEDVVIRSNGKKIRPRSASPSLNTGKSAKVTPSYLIVREIANNKRPRSAGVFKSKGKEYFSPYEAPGDFSFSFFHKYILT